MCQIFCLVWQTHVIVHAALSSWHQLCVLSVRWESSVVNTTLKACHRRPLSLEGKQSFSYFQECPEYYMRCFLSHNSRTLWLPLEAILFLSSLFSPQSYLSLWWIWRLSVKWDQLIKAAYAVVEASIVQVWDPGRFIGWQQYCFLTLGVVWNVLSSLWSKFRNQEIATKGSLINS